MKILGHDALIAARKEKNDEYYTLMPNIEKELILYAEQFADKTVYCNCDNPYKSQFYQYFKDNFQKLRLRKLICSCCTMPKINQSAYLAEYTIYDETIRLMNGNGDFRSEESIALMQQADIIVTNPPFSLFREYLVLLRKHQKRFLIMGTLNMTTYKEIFPLLQTGQIWLGYHYGDMKFKVLNDDYDGIRNICWYTNLEVNRTDLGIHTSKEYLPDNYPKYDNADAIEVSKVLDIPCDYTGVMGVPISFFYKYNPEQFEIVGFRKGDDGDDLRYFRNGRMVYPFCRILIRKRKEHENG